MGRADARDPRTRKADALAMLATPAIDVWVATASPTGAPHLVPLSLAWLEERVVIALQRDSPTARNLLAGGRARAAVGPTRDVVVIDAAVERSVDAAEDDALWEGYTAQADWDPRREAGNVFVVLRPERIQVWREVNEMAGRTLMRDGRWLV